MNNPNVHTEKKDFEDGLTRRWGPLFGFFFIYYQNRSQDSVFSETIEQYSVLENLHAYLPNQLKNIKTELRAGQQNLILLKIGSLNNGSHKMSMVTKFNVIREKSDEELAEEAVAKGTLKPKTPDNKVKVYSLKYSKGFFLLYKNDSNAVFNELLTFKTLQNLTILTQKGETKKELKINL